MNDDPIRSTVTFARRFHIEGVEGAFPPGTYLVEVSREMVEGLSFIAYKRTKTTIELPSPNPSYPARQVIEIEPSDLEAALARDKEANVGETY